MFRRFGSGGQLWRPKNPHSLDYLKYLHTVLTKNEKVTESNKKQLVEALRFISEILIWGDQNDSSVFDFFLERQMLSHFLHIMRQDSGSTLCVQLLQTLNILFENIRKDTSLYFLLSNNHVNEIMTHKFDLRNEEIMAYYISFVKTLSFKLNAATIHFFFNETTNEFPLLTESLKLFDFGESMVRIAVRTIYLNIVKVQDDAMQEFVKGASREYLKNVVDGIVDSAIELDNFVRSAENLPSNRERLRDKVDDLIDFFHYAGELLGAGPSTSDLPRLLRNRFLFPLLLNSLAPRRDDSAVLLAPVTTLFFMAQFVQVVVYTPLNAELLTALLFEDISVVSHHWVRSENSFCWKPVPVESIGEQPRVFYKALISALGVSKNEDYATFFALHLIFAIFENRGDVDGLLLAAQFPHSSRQTKGNNEEGAESVRCSTPIVEEPRLQMAEEAPPPERAVDPELMQAMRQLVLASARVDSRLRNVTLELACLVLRHFVLALDCNQMHHVVRVTAEETKAALVQRLASFVNESLFIDMFDDEFAEFECNRLRLETVGHEMLLPPSNSPLSGLPLNQRIPSGREEAIRATIQSYLHVRRLERDMRGEAEDCVLPVKVGESGHVNVGDCINLNNADLLSCLVVLNNKERLPRFLVADGVQIIFVLSEGSVKSGWAIVGFVGLLQDTQITGDPTDSRALHIVVESPAGLNKARPSTSTPTPTRRTPLLSAKLIFDDHIRCMAAKQRLIKGRSMARTAKLMALCDVLGVQRPLDSSPRGNPFKVASGCAPGSVRKHLLSPSTARSSDVPDDPHSSRKSASPVRRI